VAGHRQSILHQRLARCERSPFLSRPLAAVRLRSQRIDELERAWTHHVRMLHRNLRERVARSEIALSRSGAPRRFQIASRKAESLFERAARAALRSIHLRARQAAHLQHRLLWRSPRTLIMIQQEHARDLARRNAAAIQRLHEQRLAALRMHDAAIVALDPKGVLARGYSITRDVVSGKVIRRPSDVRPGDRISTDTNEGGFTSRVEDSQQKRLFD
jgi:exodeoxyribonuclease VII large subunit